MNSRITNKERGLIKGALRRVFSRSDLRKAVLAKTVVQGYSDPSRPRVKKWSQCSSCLGLTPTYLIDVDHVIPIIPLDSSLLEMSLEDLVDRIWCEEKNLAGLCESCHDEKTQAENAIRRKNKKEKKNNVR